MSCRYGFCSSETVVAAVSVNHPEDIEPTLGKDHEAPHTETMALPLLISFREGCTLRI